MKKQSGKNKLVITKEFMFDQDNYYIYIEIPFKYNHYYCDIRLHAWLYMYT